jgi:hypothetical protein
MGLKNKHLLLIILFLAVFNLFQVPLYSLILGRIQGVVIDKETKEPLKGVVVRLYVKAPRNEFYSTSKTETDEKGYFLFDQSKPLTYILSCHKSGYADYQPDYKIIMIADPSKYVEVINLNQGEIKHFNIEMEKGGGVMVTIFKKDENGVSPFTDFVGSIAISESEEDIFSVAQLPPASEVEENLRDSLIPSDKYDIDIQAISPDRSGHPIYRTEFTVKKNEITILSHTFDFTDITGVYGVVKFNNIPLEYGSVDLYNMEGQNISSVIINYAGKYSFRNVKPGVYKIFATFRDKGTGKRYYASKLVIIEKGISKELNINIKEQWIIR